MSSRTRFGDFMYSWVTPAALFIASKPWLFYLLSFTWGILTTIFGAVIFYFVRIFMKNQIVSKGPYGTGKYIMFGNNWGGLECGINILVADKMGSEFTAHTMKHELGHTYQNAVLGPFVIILGFIPSVIRYWYRRIKGSSKTAYDDFWYEGSATYIGELYFKKEK